MTRNRLDRFWLVWRVHMLSEKYFTHQFNPVLFRIGDVETYWYGRGYGFGFLGLQVWMLARRSRPGDM